MVGFFFEKSFAFLGYGLKSLDWTAVAEFIRRRRAPFNRVLLFGIIELSIIKIINYE
jgi:hypothetical protein